MRPVGTVAEVMASNSHAEYYETNNQPKPCYLPPNTPFSPSAARAGKVMRVAFSLFCLICTYSVATAVSYAGGSLARRSLCLSALAGVVSGIAYGVFSNPSTPTRLDDDMAKGERWAAYTNVYKVLEPLAKFGAVAAVSSFVRRSFLSERLSGSTKAMGVFSIALFGISFELGSTVGRTLRRLAEGKPAIFKEVRADMAPRDAEDQGIGEELFPAAEGLIAEGSGNRTSEQEAIPLFS